MPPTHPPILQSVKTIFKQQFNHDPVVARAPGRINLIGEHTDYNDGFVLPAAVSQSVYVAVARSGHKTKGKLISLDLNEEHTFSINNLAPLAPGRWENFLLGVVNELQEDGHSLEGFNLVFSGNIPQGAGMSSSAALECGTILALNQLFGLNIPHKRLIKMAQMAEHTFAGLKCGIMDQFSSMTGEAGHALLLDCRDLTWKKIKIPDEPYALLLCNSNVHHSLASTEYNTRREQCETGVRLLQKSYPEISSLRDVTSVQLTEMKARLPSIIYKRCKYVVEENQRVLEMAKALEEGSWNDIGQLLFKAQQGMKNEYQITCPEIDFMAEFAFQHDGILGARMMGGGFGGCTLNFVHQGAEQEFIEDIHRAYRKKFNKEITAIPVITGEGALITSRV